MSDSIEQRKCVLGAYKTADGRKIELVGKAYLDTEGETNGKMFYLCVDKGVFSHFIVEPDYFYSKTPEGTDRFTYDENNQAYQW